MKARPQAPVTCGVIARGWTPALLGRLYREPSPLAMGDSGRAEGGCGAAAFPHSRTPGGFSPWLPPPPPFRSGAGGEGDRARDGRQPPRSTASGGQSRAHAGGGFPHPPSAPRPPRGILPQNRCGALPSVPPDARAWLRVRRDCWVRWKFPTPPLRECRGRPSPPAALSRLPGAIA